PAERVHLGAVEEGLGVVLELVGVDEDAVRLAPSSGWSPRHGHMVCTGVPLSPSSLVSSEYRFQAPVGSLVWLTAISTWPRWKNGKVLEGPGASICRMVWMKRCPTGSK